LFFLSAAEAAEHLSLVVYAALMAPTSSFWAVQQGVACHGEANQSGGTNRV